MDPDPPVLSLDLWRADAVVLHFWLTSVDLDRLPFEHEGQKQALRDLLTELDQTSAAQADDEEIVRSHDLVDRTGAARAVVDADEYGLEPF